MLALVLTALALAFSCVNLGVATPTAESRPATSHAARSSGPTIRLDNGTFTGRADGPVHNFLGIPFAQPPTGNLRFRLPVANKPYYGNYDATKHGLACPQQYQHLPLPSLLGVGAAINEIEKALFSTKLLFGEDCLHLNVIVPASATPESKLPVVVWIFAGGFEDGATAIFDGGVIVRRSIELDEPVIYVSMEYRLSAFGFLGGKEIKAAGVGNLGLQDQRQAFRWVQKYISAFGGDPSKVTIWGESSGSISVALHMVANGGDNEGLFRGAFMESGGPITVGDITHGQPVYDALVSHVGCVGARDTLACLRDAPYETLLDAMNASPGIFDYSSLNIAYIPRADGLFLTDGPAQLVQAGHVADVPFVIGDVEDEATIFTLGLLNITTDAQFKAYIHANYMPHAPETEVVAIAALYPDDVAQGAPFGTGARDALTPEYKRLAAFQGDLVFQMPRRMLLNARAGTQRAWSFLHRRLKFLPDIGAAHGTDILDVYAGGELADYLIRFVRTLDPNVGPGRGIWWPQYDTAARSLLAFQDGLVPLTITPDTYRAQAMAYMQELAMKYPL